MLNKGTKAFLTDLFNIGAIKVDTKGGFRLTLHDKKPDAPLSPFYINLRTQKNPKPGPLQEAHVETIAHEMNTVLEKVRTSFHLQFDYIAGIPRAGTPFAEALCDVRIKLGMGCQLLRMQKRNLSSRALTIKSQHANKDRSGYRPRVLLVDDLITSATTKWTAIEAVRRAGYEVAGILVYLDREQGGIDTLQKSGIPVVPVMRFSQMLKFYHEERLISDAEMEAITFYLKK